MKQLLLSGYTDKEYVYDVLLDGTYHGAMTYHALQAIREANYDITYTQLHQRLQFLLDEAGYNQHPQLEGETKNTWRPIFSSPEGVRSRL